MLCAGGWVVASNPTWAETLDRARRAPPRKTLGQG